MNSRFFSLLLFGLPFFSCLHSDKIEKFRKFKQEINSVVFRKFPINDEQVRLSIDQTVNYPAGMEYLGYSSLFEIYKFNSRDSFNKNVDFIVNHSYYSYNIDDSCNYIIPGNTRSDPQCKQNRKPVPSILEEHNQLNRYIGINSKYYILDYMENDNFIKKIKGNYSFSTGAIVDSVQMTIVYWILIK
jgi:hypothetical protein